MQNPVVVIGGLEKSYMQKLALYLNTRIGKDGYVELLEGSDRQMDLLGSSGKQMELLESSGRQIDSVREDMRLQNVRHQREKHWELAVGSEAFVVALQEAGQAEQILILTDTEEEDETHISQYQARSVLFQKIIARYQSIASVGMQMAAVKKQHWIVCTGGNRGSLMAVSALCAWILARRQRVLYVEFSENSGLVSVFQLEYGTADMSDLFLQLRKNMGTSLELFTGQLDGMDYIRPPENAMILYEIREEDLQAFLRQLSAEGRYDAVVFSVGSMICGCQLIFSQAERILQISGGDLCSRCAAGEEVAFLKKCCSEEKVIKLVVSGFSGDLPGVHLLHEWSESEMGQRLRQILNAE
ncbi:hypothetical protein [Eubacterium ramulus]|uniref:hypothetical protein n=1 Tax=Eubacterium ramulus TaxID=39490 RepID=UPI0035212707